MIPKWMNKKESVRKASDQRMKQIAKKTGGKLTPNSGATPFSKGDISYPDSLLEHKMTSKASFKLNKSELVKIYNEALKVQKEPVFMIDFGDYILVGKVEKGK